MKNKWDKIFIFLQIFIVISMIVLILYFQNSNITLNAVYDLKEGNIIPEEKNVVSLDYEPGLKKEISFSVLNEEHKNMKVFLTIEGDLNDSVSLYQNIVEFMPSEEAKSFNYIIKIDKVLEPGLHTARIIGLEIPNIGPGGEYVSSKSKIVTELKVYVPYPGKYLESGLDVWNAEQNSTADFKVIVINRGKQRIENANALIEIYTLLDEKITEFESETKPVDAIGKADLSAKWNVNVFPGDYIAKVNIFYDNENKTFEKKFSVGTRNLTVEGMLVNNFQLGGIAKIQILVENKWNQDLAGVYANLIVYNSENQVIVDIKSSPEDIVSLSKKELITYWDTSNIDEGEYKGKLTIKYEDKSTEKDLVLSVGQDSLNVFGTGYALRPRIIQGTTLTTIILVFVVLLLIVNLAWFVFFRRIIGKKKKNYSK